MFEVKELSVDYLHDPIGIDVTKPRFSWKLSSDAKDVAQASYHIIVSVDGACVWDTGVVRADTSVCVVYDGEDLKPQTVYEVRLSVTDNAANAASASACFETGLFGGEGFSADWITHGFTDDLAPCAVFRKLFTLKGTVKRARVYASALGIYEFDVNGRAGSDVHFAPGWTSYQETIQYQTYDIGKLLKEGENGIIFTVGNGWYKGILGFFNQGNHYGSRTALIAQIEITYTDGTKDIIGTDESWESTTGVRRYSEIYHGEIIDMTAAENEVRPAIRFDQPKDVLTAQLDEPVRITQRIRGFEKMITPQGDVVIDFGQNLTGVVEFQTKQPRGTKIVIRHAEALDENGNFYITNLRTAKATDTFICSGEEDFFRPAFTFHGFRYIAVDGLGTDIDPADFTACVIHTDLEKAGSFECSDPQVNRLLMNIDWSLRDNFLDIPTDCPQRDERLGYTGDAQLFISTAVCCRNVASFFEKWLNDLKYEQKVSDGGVPTTVPNILGPGGGIAIWHDAAVVVPWTLYQTYGDIRFLEAQYDSMLQCMDYYADHMVNEQGLIAVGQQLGDWVSMDVPRGPWLKRDEPVWNLELIEKMGATDAFFVANAYYVNSLKMVVEAARVLGKNADAEKYRKRYDALLEAVRAEYITRTGRVISSTQTANILALQFGIAEEKDRPRMMASLLENLKAHKNHLTTGFAGTPFLCPVLSENGAHDVAGSVFLKDDCPSWLYSVKLGGTTMWELWDGVNPDGSFNKFEMNSLNHYSYGSIGSWVYHDLLGLTALEPGYKKSKIAPRLVIGIPEMKGSLETVYGTLACEISCRDGKYRVKITIPTNTTAVVSLPERDAETLGSGTYTYEYETKSVFVKARYNLESTFGDLLENPVGMGIFRQYAAELVENELFMMFAKDQTIETVLGMLPAEIKPLIDMVIAQCNANPID